MTALPQDEELSALLNDLDDLDEAVEVFKPKPASGLITKPTTEIETQTEVETSNEIISVNDQDVVVSEHESDSSPPDDPKADWPNLYSNSLHELLTNYRKDRQDLDKFIAYLWSKLGNQEVSRVFFESLAVSLRTKSEANANLVKLIDNIGKRLEKSSGGIEDLNLEDLLDG